ncbi:MAG TPA: hypothetical protein DCZ92_01760 [Elusimicrobia bacterium]|nr:MAG: hypothetical protein A2016_07725 [Elusimicrobia bacterium GWF2_62_30]HBA59552.1 hypothetical protein [Elusimicrobiota bacterium]
MTREKKAFTLIELMIVVAIIGVLAAIAIPKFASLIDKSREGYTKGGLATMRTAINVYYSDNEGLYPADDLSSLILNAKYIAEIPVVKIPLTPHRNSVKIVTPASEALFISDTGGWAYANARTDADWGHIAVNCNHNDSGGNIWSTY